MSKQLLVTIFIILFSLNFLQAKDIAYIVSDIRIPFWDIMSRGIVDAAKKRGHEVKVYSADNDRKKELENTLKAIKDGVEGIIISPTSSLASVTILKLAKEANIPVVISDIGSDRGEYVSYISSDNRDGAYKIGKVLAKEMTERGFEDGSVGIVAIPQKRLNGQLRTAGFMQALDEAGIKGAGIKQQVDFSYEETYEFSKEFIENHKDLRAIWLQGSDRYKGALDAIDDAGKSGEILLICFDAEPIFLELIPEGVLVGAAMQQPYLMGEKALITLEAHLKNQEVEKNIELEILAISEDNIEEKLPVIKRNVLGITE